MLHATFLYDSCNIFINYKLISYKIARYFFKDTRKTGENKGMKEKNS